MCSCVKDVFWVGWRYGDSFVFLSEEMFYILDLERVYSLGVLVFFWCVFEEEGGKKEDVVVKEEIRIRIY